MSADIGVYMNRKLIRNAVRGKNPAATPERMHERANAGLPTHCYTNNSVMDIPRRAAEQEDREMIRRLGRSIVEIAAEGDAYVGRERDDFIRQRLEALESTLQ